MYKSIKIKFTTWQAMTRIIAKTGETFTRLIDRLVKVEMDRLDIRSEEE